MDFGESPSQVPWNIFEEDECRADLTNDSLKMGPNVARIAAAKPLARATVRLARVARRDDLHEAAPRSAVEGLNAIPDRSRIQRRRLHPGHENARRVAVPLNVTNGS